MKKIVTAAIAAAALLTACSTTASYTNGDCTVEYATRNNDAGRFIAAIDADELAEACE